MTFQLIKPSATVFYILFWLIWARPSKVWHSDLLKLLYDGEISDSEYSELMNTWNFWVKEFGAPTA